MLFVAALNGSIQRASRRYPRARSTIGKDESWPKICTRNPPARWRTSAASWLPRSRLLFASSTRLSSETAPYRARPSSSSPWPSPDVTQCPYCIQGHTKAAVREGATPQEVMEAIWVAAEMRAGGAYAHSTLALSVLDGSSAKDRPVE